MKVISDVWGAIVGIFLFFVICGLVLGGLMTIFGGESEGTVKYDDCRQTITIKQNSWDTLFKKFICSDFKSNSGKLISGTCVHIDTESGSCKTVYIYTKEPDINCGNNSTPDVDDKCYCNYGYHVDPNNKMLCVIDPLPSPTDIFTTPIPINLDQPLFKTLNQ